MQKISIILSAISILTVFLPTASAQEPAIGLLQTQMQELQQTLQAMKTAIDSQNEVICRQSMKIEALEKGSAIRPAGAKISAPAGAPETAGISQGLNPDIGLLGTVQAQSTQNTEDAEGKDTIALKELELSMSQYVDPYSRLDAIITFNDRLENQNVDIEEAYYTRWGLPLGFQGQIGKFRSKIGKANLQHLHQLDTVDYPLVIQDFFGEEGLASSGVRLQNHIPNPWDIPVEITGEVLRGNNGNSFSGISRRPIFSTHLKTFFEPMENTNLEWGATAMFGDENINRLPQGGDRYGVHVFGWDATLLHDLAEGRAIKFQNEIYLEDRTGLVTPNDRPWGFYSLLDYKFSQRFSAGLRFDYVEPREITGQHVRTTGISPYFTFWQSEFADFRIQYSHTEPAASEAKSDNAVILAANFLIGAHKHPVQ